MNPSISGYLQLDVEEIVKESDTAFLLRFPDGEESWFLKSEITRSRDYVLGDRNVTLHLAGKE